MDEHHATGLKSLVVAGWKSPSRLLAAEGTSLFELGSAGVRHSGGPHDRSTFWL